MDSDRDLLRHCLATLAYRASKALRDPPPGFAAFRAGPTTRTPIEILSHLGDLMAWGRNLAEGEHVWHESEANDWSEQITRFYANLAACDAYLVSGEQLGYPPAKLLQGPVADALTHVGQISMLRRLAEAPVKGENYFKAEITVGRLGPDQPTAKYEFD